MNEEFNVVIAEDEKRICSLIKALIDWDGLHLRLVGEAHDGVQALTLLQQEKVDILITEHPNARCQRIRPYKMG